MEKNTEFICFTSAVGGSGCSSAARAFSRISAAIFCKKVLCIGLDPISRKNAPDIENSASASRLLIKLSDRLEDLKEIINTNIVKDDYGVSYFSDKNYYNPLSSIHFEELQGLLKAISDSYLFDIVVLDCSVNSPEVVKTLSLCEKIVVVYGYHNSSKRLNKEFCSHIDKYIKCFDIRPEIHEFMPLEDIESFFDGDVDIHGQFGAEVRELASELLGE